MPGEISRSIEARDDMPYVPSWCYATGPKMCPCGCHEGYHNDDRECLRRAKCGCTGIPAELVTPVAESTLGLTQAEEEEILDRPWKPEQE